MATEAQSTKKTYVFPLDLIEESDGRWSASVPTLAGCATWGNSSEEALHHIQEAVELHVGVMLEHGDTLPQGVEVRESPVIAVTQ